MLFFVFFYIFCFAEDLTITTYYPSPYGSYNELSTNMLKFGLKEKESTICDATREGVFIYDDSENSLYVCQGASGWKKVGASTDISEGDGYIRIGNSQICYGKNYWPTMSPQTKDFKTLVTFPAGGFKTGTVPAVSVTTEYASKVVKIGINDAQITKDGFWAEMKTESLSSGGWGFYWVAIGKWK
jgi:hypothetical protein